MPLSEHEQRLLEQIERALYEDDPKFASTVRATDLRTHLRRRLRRAGLLLALGFLLLIAGVVTTKVPVGILGFLVMLAALLLAMTSWRRIGAGGHPVLRSVGGQARPVRGGRRRSGPASGGWLHRLEERWRRRWDERG